MSVLTLRIEPKTRETFYSFVARLAAVNGVSLENFLSDFDLSSTGFFAVHGHVVDAIARLADLSSVQVKELVSWTGQPQGKVRMDYRGERIVSRAIRNLEVHGCPDMSIAPPAIHTRTPAGNAIMFDREPAGGAKGPRCRLRPTHSAAGHW